MDLASAGDGFAACWIAGAGVVDARCVAGFLQAHIEVEEVHEDLHVALRLEVAAHRVCAHTGKDCE